MGLFSRIKNRIIRTYLGDLITDLGTLPIDNLGREISLSIRQFPGEPPHLQVIFKYFGDRKYCKITCMKAWANHLEHVAQEMRKHADDAK